MAKYLKKFSIAPNKNLVRAMARYKHKKSMDLNKILKNLESTLYILAIDVRDIYSFADCLSIMHDRFETDINNLKNYVVKQQQLNTLFKDQNT